MNELFSSHFVQEPYAYIQTLTDYRVHQFMEKFYPSIMAIGGFILGYSVRHLQSVARKYRYKKVKRK